MNIDKVTYSKIYPTSGFLNERVGVEISVSPGSDPMEALRAGKLLCDEFNKEANPNLYKYNSEPLTAEEAAIVKEIELCEDVKKLAFYKINMKKNIKPYYMERLKTLTDNFSNK